MAIQDPHWATNNIYFTTNTTASTTADQFIVDPSNWGASQIVTTPSPVTVVVNQHQPAPVDDSPLAWLRREVDEIRALAWAA